MIGAAAAAATGPDITCRSQAGTPTKILPLAIGVAIARPYSEIRSMRLHRHVRGLLGYWPLLLACFALLAAIYVLVHGE
jgi:hypothetical protein